MNNNGANSMKKQQYDIENITPFVGNTPGDIWLNGATAFRGVHGAIWLSFFLQD